MKISVSNEFWTADIHWKSEPVEELRQLHALLATDIHSALIGLESLAFQGSLAAALYIAMQLDLHPAEPGNEEVVMKWYLDAATRGSRAASYRLGKLQTDNGDTWRQSPHL
jgi:TPR repeat protein